MEQFKVLPLNAKEEANFVQFAYCFYNANCESTLQ